ncbi:MAG TPA: alpha-ribazole phosphatase [Gaiella sp.]
MRLVLVRHAETEKSARGRCYGSLDVGLSPAGKAQCARLAEALAADRVAAVVSSPRTRALETAQAIAEPHSVEVHVDSDLQELDFGELEGRPYDEIAEEMPDLYAAWMTTPTRVEFPGGESYADLARRARGAVERLRRQRVDGTAVAVTHGGIVRAVLADVLGIPDDRIFRIAVEPASVAIVEWVEDVPTLVALGGGAYPSTRADRSRFTP